MIDAEHNKRPAMARDLKLSLGAVVSAIVVAIGVLQPVVNTVVAGMIDDARWKTRVEGRLDNHEAAISEIREIRGAIHRLEIRLGTAPEQQP